MVVIKTQGNELVCVCITSQVDQVPDGKRVLIPIDLVELEKKSAAHCGWVRYFAIDQVQEIMPTRLPKMVFDAIKKLANV